MRIIGGQHRGHRFNPPRKTPARPTTDIAKEGLFNIIINNFDLEETKALDLYGGTGSISYELCSRGCLDVTNVEISNMNIRFIKEMKEKLDFPIKVIKDDVFKFMKRCDERFDFIFAGPPYPSKRIPDLPEYVFGEDLLNKNGWFVMEHNPNHTFKDHLHYWKERNYGTTIFSIFVTKENEHV